MAEETKNPIVLSIKNLNVYFKTHGKDSHVIRGVNLDVKRGEVFAIVGESGSGKSVFTKTFTGMLETNGKIKTGSITLNDIPLNDPTLIRRKFKDIHRHDLKTAREDKKEAVKAAEISVGKISNAADKRIAKLQKKADLWTDKGYREYQEELASQQHNKKEAYLAAYYRDQLTKAYNDLSNNASRKQKETDSFLKKLNNLMNPQEYENKETLFSEFSLLFEKAVSANETLSALRKAYESATAAVADHSKEDLHYKDLLKQKTKVGYRYAKKYRQVFFAALTQFRKQQVVEFPLNKKAYEDFLTVLENSIEDLVAKTAKNDIDGIAGIESGIAKLIATYSGLKPSLSALKSLSQTVLAMRAPYIAKIAQNYSGDLIENIGLENHELFQERFAHELSLSSHVEKLRKWMSQYTNLKDPKYLKYLEELQKEELRLFEKSYNSLFDFCLERVNEMPESLKLNHRHFMADLLDSIDEHIYAGVNSYRQICSLHVLEVRSEQEKAFASEKEFYKTKLDKIAATKHDDPAKVQQFENKIAKVKAVKNQKIAVVQNKKEATVAAFSAANKDIVDKNGLDPRYLTYPPKIVDKLVAIKKIVEDTSHELDGLEERINQKKEEAMTAFDKNDLNKIISISAEIGLGYKYFVHRLARIEKEHQDGCAQIKARKEALPNDERREELLRLIKVEEESSDSNYTSAYAQVLNEFKHAVHIYSAESSFDVVLLNEKIHNAKEEVSKIRILWRKICSHLAFKTPMVKKLRNEGIIRGNSVNLAKLKTNREWSMIRGSHIATIFQDPMTSLNPLLTIGSQISDVLRLHHNLTRVEAKKEAISLLGRVHIPNPEERFKEYPYQYSGGMRQRVVIAIALACRPDILICDEPTTALDVTVQAQILELIKDLQVEFGFTTIFITHDLGVVAGVADRIGVMYGGQFVEIGTDEDIFYHSAHPYTWALLSSLPQLAVENEPLVYIRGNPPVFTKEIEGDAFAPRSDYAMRIDTMMEPPMFKISDTHSAKTWLLDPRAPKVKKPTIIRNLAERMKKTVESFVVTEDEGE